MSHTKAPRRRPLLVFLVLAGVLGVGIIGLSQCRLVDDTVTGVDLRSQASLSTQADCIKGCNEAYKNALKAEDDRFAKALQGCGSDQECKQNERTIHQQNDANIRDQMQTCKNGCYNEGSGSAGK